MTMTKGTILNYCGKTAVVVLSGQECTAQAGGDVDDHLGLWFGETGLDGKPAIYIIPAEYVRQQNTCTNFNFIH